ncbi:MAG: carboxymuconolactone decarboxylase family protein [Phycisphaerales bacterium]|nr:carboxymuconolactone decarboxylase family protein [Phycisphaerales bacterium]
MRIKPNREAVLSAFKAVQDAPVFSESDALVRSGQMPVEMIQAMTASPDVLRGFAAMCDAVYPGGTICRRVQELVILTASVENACQFCTQSHLDIARQIGVSDDPASLLEDPTKRTPEQDLACRWTLQLLRDANAVDEALFQAVHAQFGDAGTVELTMLVGYIHMLNMFNNALQNRYHGELAGPEQTP